MMPQKTRGQRRGLFGKSKWGGEKRLLKGKIREMMRGGTPGLLQMSLGMNEELEDNGRGSKKGKQEKGGKGERHKERSWSKDQRRKRWACGWRGRGHRFMQRSLPPQPPGRSGIRDSRAMLT